jgi:hypothetical protein
MGEHKAWEGERQAQHWASTRLREYIQRMNRAIFCALFLPLLSLTPLHAQADRWQVTLGADTYVWDVQLVRLDGDSLVVMQADSLVRVPVDHVTELRLIRKTEVRAGTDATAETMSALTGADDEIYDLSALEFADRLRTIQKILLVHPTAP